MPRPPSNGWWRRSWSTFHDNAVWFYLDDFLVHAASFQNSLSHLKEVFTWICLVLNHSMIDLALYLGSLFCKKLNPVSGLLQTPTFFFPKMVLYLAPSMFPSTLAVFPVPDEERQPQTMHDAATTPFDSGDVLRVICCVTFTPNITSCVLTKPLNFGFIRPEHRLPRLMWQTSKGSFYVFLWKMAFFWPLFHTGLSYRQILPP